MVQHADIDHTGIPGTGGTPSLASSESFLAANVSLAAADTFYDGPSLSLGAGTWLVMATAVMVQTNIAQHLTCKLWDGTNIYAMAEEYAQTSGGTATLTVFGLAVLVGTTTVKLSVARDAGTGGTILDQTQVNGTADKASKITAVQIA